MVGSVLRPRESFSMLPPPGLQGAEFNGPPPFSAICHGEWTSRWHALGSASVLSQDRHIPMVLGKSHSGHRGHRAALGATKAVPKPHAGVEMESEIIN